LHGLRCLAVSEHLEVRGIGALVRRCIYCLEEKEDKAFNREHVVPQAFGTFDSRTPVLECVCQSCNGALGRELDEKLARDSIEGLDRIQAGIKDASTYKTLGRRSTMHVEFDKAGPLRGARGFHLPDPAGSQKLAVTPIPQIGFSRSKDGEFEWFPVHALPSQDELIARYGRGTEAFIRTWEIPIQEAQDALEAKGFARGTVSEQTEPPSGSVRTEIVAKISEPEFRAYSKIAFNYLAFVCGPRSALRPEFNEVRRFVHAAVQPPSRIVKVERMPWIITRNGTDAALVGHYLAVCSVRDTIVAHVSLFTRLRYTITLADGGFVIPVRVGAGHIFDVEGRSVTPIPSEEVPGLFGEK
jgi:hypothetical protein